MDLRISFADCGEGGALDHISEAGGKAHGAQHAQLVFVEATMRVADGADYFLLEIVEPTDEIEHIFGLGIEQQSVDGKVAALDVKLSFGRKLHLVRMAAVRVSPVAAIGGDLDVVV